MDTFQPHKNGEGEFASDLSCSNPVFPSFPVLFFFPLNVKKTLPSKNMHIYTELYTVVNVSPSNVQIQVLVNYNNVVQHSLGGVVF